jgi:hypothetical protein
LLLGFLVHRFCLHRILLRNLICINQALRLCRLKVSGREDLFVAIIRCTADPAKVDKRTRSKWSRVLRYAAGYKLVSEPLGEFVKRKGGINACAARFSRAGARCSTLDANEWAAGAEALVEARDLDQCVGVPPP